MRKKYFIGASMSLLGYTWKWCHWYSRILPVCIENGEILDYWSNHFQALTANDIDDVYYIPSATYLSSDGGKETVAGDCPPLVSKLEILMRWEGVHTSFSIMDSNWQSLRTGQYTWKGVHVYIISALMCLLPEACVNRQESVWPVLMPPGVAKWIDLPW